jgi:hypothetical protein
VELTEGKLFVEPVKVGGGWLWRNDKIDNRRGLSLAIIWVSLWWKERRVGWGVLVVRWFPLHGVIHFSR